MRPSTDDVVLDPQAAHPEFGHLRAALTAQDWRACRAVLDTASLSGRSWLLGCAAEERGIEGLLEYVLQTDPNDSTAAALLGLNLIDIGWAARGTALAMHVGAGEFEIFHDWLRRAETVLIDAAARCPWDPALWTARLMTARGLQLGLAESRRRYARLAAADAQHLPGQLQFLQRLCPKWGGTREAMHTWAWETMQSAPPGAPQGVLVAQAHIEHWLELAQQDLTAGRTYLAGQPVRDVLYQAAHHSIWHPEFRRDPGWVTAASTFAMVFALMEDPAAATPTFAMLGGLASRSPWKYLGDDPAEQVRQYRRKFLVSEKAR